MLIIRREDQLTAFLFGVHLEDCAILFVGVSHRNPTRAAGSNLMAEPILVKLLVEFDETKKMADRGKHALTDMVSGISYSNYSGFRLGAICEEQGVVTDIFLFSEEAKARRHGLVTLGKWKLLTLEI